MSVKDILLEDNIDSSILVNFSQVNIEDLIKNLKAKDFEKVRKWCVNNLDNDAQVFMRRIYDALYENFDNLSKAAAVPIVAKYQYQLNVRSRSRDKSLGIFN